MLWIPYFVLAAAQGVGGKYTTGHLITSENWAFVARFCFLSEDGEFEYSIQFDEDYGTINLLLYYDSETQWPAVYKTNKMKVMFVFSRQKNENEYFGGGPSTCQQKEAVLKIEQNQIVNLTTSSFNSGCVLLGLSESLPLARSSVKQPRTISCHSAKRFKSSRERWWFIAFSNCKSGKGLNVRYKFLMTNGVPGDYWHEHLSADEFYILPVLLAFTLIYLLLVFVIFICTVELKARQFLHATYKIFIASVALQLIGIMAQCTSYLRYASDGVGYARLKNFGRVAESASEILYLLLLLLLAKGYTVTRGRLRLASSVKMTIFMCIYVVCYISLFIYEREIFDPGEVLYLYECPAGYGLIVLRITAWWMFIYSTIFTLKHYPEKATFYYPFNIIGTLWFVAGPGVVLAANNLIDKWVRESIVCAAFHIVAFGGHVLFLILTLPSKANKNFPYHVRTNQIGMMEINGFSGNSSIYQFSHHPYAPGGPLPSREVPLELFTIPSHFDMIHLLDCEYNHLNGSNAYYELPNNGYCLAIARRDVRDYESQAFPHETYPEYPQTIFLPFTVRNNSDDTSIDSSGYNTPREKEEGPELRVKSAEVTKSDKLMDEDLERRVSSLECLTTDLDFRPSAPLEERGRNDSDSGHNSRPRTASTISINTAMKNEEVRLSIEKLKSMFAAQSLRKSSTLPSPR